MTRPPAYVLIHHSPYLERRAFYTSSVWGGGGGAKIKESSSNSVEQPIHWQPRRQVQLISRKASGTLTDSLADAARRANNSSLITSRYLAWKPLRPIFFSCRSAAVLCSHSLSVRVGASQLICPSSLYCAEGANGRGEERSLLWRHNIQLDKQQPRALNFVRHSGPSPLA